MRLSWTASEHYGRPWRVQTTTFQPWRTESCLGGQQRSGMIERLPWRVATTLEGPVGLGGSTLVLNDQQAVLASSATCGMSETTLAGRYVVNTDSTHKTSCGNSTRVAGLGGSRGRTSAPSGCAIQRCGKKRGEEAHRLWWVGARCEGSVTRHRTVPLSRDFALCWFLCAPGAGLMAEVGRYRGAESEGMSAQALGGARPTWREPWSAHAHGCRREGFAIAPRGGAVPWTTAATAVLSSTT